MDDDVVGCRETGQAMRLPASQPGGLIAAEVAGILGALLAIPVTGIIQVVLGDIWAHRGGRRLRLPLRADNSPENADRSDAAE